MSINFAQALDHFLASDSASDLISCLKDAGSAKERVVCAVEALVKNLGPFHADRVDSIRTRRYIQDSWSLLYNSKKKKVYITLPWGGYVTTVTAFLGDYGQTSYPERISYKGLRGRYPSLPAMETLIQHRALLGYSGPGKVWVRAALAYGGGSKSLANLIIRATRSPDLSVDDMVAHFLNHSSSVNSLQVNVTSPLPKVSETSFDYWGSGGWLSQRKEEAHMLIAIRLVCALLLPVPVPGLLE